MQPMYAAPMAPPSYGVPMQPMQAPIAMEMQAPGSIQPGQLLGPHNKVTIFQKSKKLEAITGGIWESKNEYVILDASGKHPILVAKEKSTMCCRQCCAPYHPLSIEFFPATNVDERLDKNKPTPHMEIPHMTALKQGCCDKMTGCCACGPSCLDEMQLYSGHTNLEADPKRRCCGFNSCSCCGDKCTTPCFFNYPAGMAPIGSVVEPKGGGGCKPELWMLPRGIEQQDYHTKPQDIVGAIVGPCIFGGCSEYCCNAKFDVKSDRLQNMSLKKLAPRDMSEVMRTAFTDSDIFEINFAPGMTNTEKALMLTSSLLVDYKFFEFDRECPCLPKGCDIKSADNGCDIIITLFKCSIYGCLCPCQCTIPIRGGEK